MDMKHLGMFLAALAASLAAYSQNIRPVYEAATIKPNVSGSGGSTTRGSQGQIVFTNVTLKRLVEQAYGVKPIQVSGPPWMEDVRFDVSAKYPPDTKAPERRLMLRALLGERFHLVAHTETREMQGYALVAAKSGFKLKPTESADTNESSNGDGKILTYMAKGVTMAQVADTLGRRMGEFVVDRTGIQGKYEFTVRWSTDDQNAAVDPDPAPSLFSALQEKLGLRLQAQKVPVEIVVVDRIDRTPAEN